VKGTTLVRGRLHEGLLTCTEEHARFLEPQGTSAGHCPAEKAEYDLGPSCWLRLGMKCIPVLDHQGGITTMPLMCHSGGPHGENQVHATVQINLSSWTHHSPRKQSHQISLATQFSTVAKRCFHGVGMKLVADGLMWNSLFAPRVFDR
jgi:hypothetical protein